MCASFLPPPSGLVAFLLSDIEGSTALYERTGEDYRVAQERHHALLRGAFNQRRGHEFKETGDGFMVAFADPADCLASALAGQEALRSEAWLPKVGSIRARMALHWGEATLQGGDYRGLALHRASRILGAAHGGQILCSEAFCEVLPPQWREEFAEIGLFRLRDVAQPMRLFQARSAETLAGGFPPLRAAPASTHNLPLQATRFFGRRRDLQQLQLLLKPKEISNSQVSTGRLVTLLGPGGAGKTRLALAVAEDLLSAYQQAVWFVSLAGVRSAHLFFESIRESLRFALDEDQSARDQVVRFLGAQPSLLILDNFEQLSSGAATMVGEMLADLPHLCCLVTSRHLLQLGGEIEYALAPLTVPRPRANRGVIEANASVQLFCDRAALARPQFVLSDGNTEDVAELCRVLEGIPLALELAAARINVLTPQQMRKRLHRQLEFLTSRRTDMPERHRTVRATMDWSFQLLTPDLRKSFAGCAIFRGGWNLEAAEFVLSTCAGLTPVLDVLTALRESSLLVVEEIGSEMRFRMLDVIREFAEEQLQPETRSVVSARHHTYFREALERTAALGEDARLAWLDREHENLRVCLGGGGPVEERAQIAVTLHQYWITRGLLAEGGMWLHQLTMAELAPTTRARVLHTRGILAWRAGDFTGAEQLLRSALEDWLRLGNTRNASAIWNNLGILANSVEDYDSASEYYQRGLQSFRELGLDLEVAAALSNLGENAMRQGDLAAAQESLLESLALQRRSTQLTDVANTLHNLAELHVQRAEWPAARRYLAESLHIRVRLDSREDNAASFATLAQLAEGEERNALALRCVWAAEQSLRQSPSRATAAVKRQVNAVSARLQAPPAILSCTASELEPHELLDADGNWQERD